MVAVIGTDRTESCQWLCRGTDRTESCRWLCRGTDRTESCWWQCRGTERTGRNGKNTRALKSSRGWDSRLCIYEHEGTSFLLTKQQQNPCFRIPVSISSAQHKSQQRGLRENKLQEREASSSDSTATFQPLRRRQVCHLEIA